MSNRQLVHQDYKLVNSKYKLNTSEIKIVMNAISEIKMEDKDFHTYRIKLSDISKELHNQSLSRSYTRLKNFCENLLKKPLYIPKEDGGFLVVNWFSSLEYISGTAEIEYDINPKLKPYLLELKERFVKYNLKYILPLSSNYSIRIYQLLKEYEGLTRRTFTVDELRELLQVPKSYQDYNRFKEKVLKVAEKELIKHCDIFFEYEEIKEGRRVNEILFRIKQNKLNLEEKTPQLFTPESNKFEQYKYKKIKTADGEKEINFIEDLGDFLKVYFVDEGHAKIKDIKILKELTK